MDKQKYIEQIILETGYKPTKEQLNLLNSMDELTRNEILQNLLYGQTSYGKMQPLPELLESYGADKKFIKTAQKEIAEWYFNNLEELRKAAIELVDYEMDYVHKFSLGKLKELGLSDIEVEDAFKTNKHFATNLAFTDPDMRGDFDNFLKKNTGMSIFEVEDNLNKVPDTAKGLDPVENTRPPTNVVDNIANYIEDYEELVKMQKNLDKNITGELPVEQVAYMYDEALLERGNISYEDFHNNYPKELGKVSTYQNKIFNKEYITFEDFYNELTDGYQLKENVTPEQFKNSLENFINEIENPRLQEGIQTKYNKYNNFIENIVDIKVKDKILTLVNQDIFTDIISYNKYLYTLDTNEDIETGFFDYEEPTPVEDAFLADREGWDVDKEGNFIKPETPDVGTYEGRLNSYYELALEDDAKFNNYRNKRGGSLGAAKLNDPNVFTDAAMIVPDVKISKLLKNKAKLLAIDGINALDVYEIGLILGALIEPGVEKALNPIMPILFPGIDKEKIKDNKSYKEQVIGNLQMTAKISPTDIALDKYNEKNSSKLGMDSIVMTQLTPNIGRVPRKIKKSRYNKDYNWIEGLING